MHAKGIQFATITHAAGISSTGDAKLDLRLPFDEPYDVPETTAAAIRQTQARRGRVIAVGTTVVRALEHAARDGEVRSGDGIATQRVGAGTRLRLVNAILSGTHETWTSHYELLRAFTFDTTLRRAANELEAAGYRTHEFGDSVLIEQMAPEDLSVERFPQALERGSWPLSRGGSNELRIRAIGGGGCSALAT